MRIGILGPISWRVPPVHYGGWELVVHHLTEGLVRRGHDVTLFASGDSQTAARLSSVVPEPLSMDPELGQYSRVYESLHMANAFAGAGSFDILHNNLGSYPVAFTQLCPVPMLTTLHGSGAEADSKLIYRRFPAGPYVSISNSERALIPELDYAATVYNGIDESQFSFSREAGEYLLVVGRMSPDKGIHFAIEVARRTNMPLILAGIVPPENKQYFDEQVAPHLNAKIRFVGPVNLEQKSRLYAEAWAFLHLVDYEEAFGLTMVEAMACGCPVIGFKKGSVPEVIADTETGFIVADTDAAVKAVGAVRSIDRSACRSRVANLFSAERMVEGYEAVYRQILGFG
ncbi:MAG: glycosyl transferase group 1 [Chloroflexi bacterium]|nr:glycosyl transferase group 1 [Chloroflexota bacterium]